MGQTLVGYGPNLLGYGSLAVGPVLVLVPDVDDQTQATALSLIAAATLLATIANAYSSTVPAGTVISQSPAAGTSVPAGSTVVITVSLGPQVVTQPLTGVFAPEIAEILEDAFERAGVDPRAIDQEKIASAKRSMRFMLHSEWPGYGVNQWQITERTLTTIAGQVTYQLPAGTIDVIDIVMRRQGLDTPVNRTTRSDYLMLALKQQRGRPDRFWVERLAFLTNLTVWPVPENNSDQFVYTVFKQANDVGGLSTSLDLPAHMVEAFTAGLAARFAQKWGKDRFADLQVEYKGSDPDRIGGKLAFALHEDRERADVTFTFGRRRR